ncbi:hypothetical protein BYT27DRAFT_7181459 [Phlegmacium glaucopus]|nr:hypothetical protein BYT27DRAFT_7181459 [Phlegmacium glaucopus]
MTSITQVTGSLEIARKGTTYRQAGVLRFDDYHVALVKKTRRLWWNCVDCTKRSLGIMFLCLHFSVGGSRYKEVCGSDPHISLGGSGMSVPEKKVRVHLDSKVSLKCLPKLLVLSTSLFQISPNTGFLRTCSGDTLKELVSCIGLHEGLPSSNKLSRLEARQDYLLSHCSSVL